MLYALVSLDSLHQPPLHPATEPPYPIAFPRALVHLIWSVGCSVTIPTPHPLHPRKWEVEPPG